MAPIGGTDFSKLRILVVEDNAHFRTLVRTILETIGVSEIEEARDGAEAIELLKSFKADLAIVDWKMDGLDGVECVRRLRSAEDSPNRFLPLIMVTGYSNPRLIRSATDAGVDDLLAKPISAKSLLSRIVLVLERERRFFATEDYFGPDRRCRELSFKGPDRRIKERCRVPMGDEAGRE